MEKQIICIKDCKLKGIDKNGTVRTREFKAGEVYPMISNYKEYPEIFQEYSISGLLNAIDIVSKEIGEKVKEANAKKEAKEENDEDEDEVCDCEFCKVFSTAPYEEEDDEDEEEDYAGAPKFKVGDYGVGDCNKEYEPAFVKVYSVQFYGGKYVYNREERGYYDDSSLRKPTKEELKKYFR